ncbi:MAG: Demethylrebeccamycin-D-glucose O-methyltransferase [Pelotomaculum sp. PtaB.Bin104]|nr:MAG: Demethylrebeccamycin-D-glucose O-methyltransferase [Pelotomaculum sp. PtaB.Bin104]
MSSYLEAATAMGTGSLHPGGFMHTLKVLQLFSLTPEDIVIDIGCGAGRTACHIAKSSGAYVFGLDNSQEMLDKAKFRAAREGLQVQFVHGDAGDLPFLDNVADLILIESVLIFLPKVRVIDECLRVLKKGGMLVSTELLADQSMPAAAKEQVQSTCGLTGIPSFEEWLDMFQSAGFTRTGAWRNSFPGPLQNLINILHPDPYQVVSQSARTNREINQVLRSYQRLMQKNRKYLGYGTFIMKK